MTMAARWATVQVDRHGHSVAKVVDDLQCGWHTVMDAVAFYGTPLIDDPGRFGAVAAVGLDERLFVAGWSVPPPVVVDPDRRCRRRPAARHRPRS
jgi:hypothetical protein